MSLIGNVDTPASYVADYMQACVGMLGIPAGGFTADIEAFGATNEFNVEALYGAMLNSSIGRSIYAPGSSNATFAAKLVEKLGGSLLSDDAEAWALDWAEAQLDAGMSRAALAMELVEAVSAVDTTDENFGAVALQFSNRIEVANYYTFSSTSPSTSVSTLTSALSTVTNTSDVSTTAKIVAILDANPSGGTSTGQTFTLTTGTDVISGTSGNDTIIGDNSGTDTFTASDAITGGAGTDTFKLYNAAADALDTIKFPGVSGVEQLYMYNGTTTSAATMDISGMADVTSLELDSPVAMTNGMAFTIKGTSSQAVTLTKLNGTGTAGNNSTVTLDGPTGVTVNAVGTTSGTVTIDAKATGVKTFDLTTTGSGTTGASKVTLTNTGNAMTALNIKGAGDVTVTESDADIVTITNTATGTVNVDVSGKTLGATFAYTGGTGKDTLTLADGALGLLTAGSQLNGGDGSSDKLGLKDTALSSAELTKLNATTGFEVLGLNAAITLDASGVTAMKNFSLDTAAIKTISNMSTGAQITATVDDTNALNFSGATGVNDLKFTLGSATTTDIDLTAVTIGQTTVALESLGKGTATNTITTLTNADNSVYTVTGSNDLTITNALAATATGTKVDANAFTGKLSVKGSAKTDVLIGGSGNDTIDGGTITVGVAASTETAAVKFASAAQNKTVTFAGLALTVTDAGGMTANEIAAAFASLAVGATAGNATTKGTYAGTVASWSTGAAATDTVTFTSTTANTNVTNLAQGTAGTEQAVTSITVTDGTNGTAQSVDQLTGNGGGDTFVFSNADIGTVDASAVVTAIITDFVSGTDKIKDTTVGAAGSSTNYVEATGAAASMAALNTAAGTALDGTVKYYVGQFGSDSYVYTDANGTGITNVIKLTGVALTGIAATDFVA